MNKCGTCKYWDKESAIGYIIVEADSTQQVGECKKAAESWFDQPGCMVGAADMGEGVSAQLFTDSNFACILWEPKPTTTT